MGASMSRVTPGASILVLSIAALAGCTAEPAASDAPLRGTWTITWDVDDLYDALGGEGNPEARALAEGNAGTIELEFGEDRYDLRWVEASDSCPGTYEVDGDRVVLTATIDPSAWDCGDGVGQLVADAAWSVEGDTLELSEWNLSPQPAMDWFVHALLGTEPLERVASDPSGAGPLDVGESREHATVHVGPVG